VYASIYRQLTAGRLAPRWKSSPNRHP